MIPNQVKNLFVFIDFLESNKKNYTDTYAALTDRFLQLKDEQSKLSPSRNYKDKQRHDVIQKEIDEKAPIIQTNVVNPIVDKLLGLGIWDGDGACASIWNNNAGAISELTRNFTDAEAEEVKKHKQMYLAFRAETNQALRFLDLTFDSLDQVMKDLFDFFKDTEQNEFEAFQVKPIRVNSAEEVAELFQKGYKKFELPNDFVNLAKNQQNWQLQPMSAKPKERNNIAKDAEQDEGTELGLEEIFKRWQEQDKVRDEQLKSGFVELEKYIVKNIYENVKADYERLKQLKRNLLTWKAQLTTVFIEPENQERDDLEYFNGMKANAERMVGKIVSALEIIGERIEHKQPAHPVEKEVGRKGSSIIVKPILKPELFEIVFDILKDFFSQEQKPIFEKILRTGDNANEHLIFLDNGNRLADAFKQLKKADVISGCEQKELEKWISDNFKFRFRRKIKDFKLRYLNDIISTNKDFCKKPLLNVSYEKGTGKVLITKA